VSQLSVVRDVTYASLGLEVQITEMDVSLYVPRVTYTSDTFYTPATFTDALQTQQAERYGWATLRMLP